MTSAIILTIIALVETVALVLVNRERRTAEELAKALIAYMESRGQLPSDDDIDPFLKAAVRGEYNDW